jgi:predicted transglutaminase-like protease
LLSDDKLSTKSILSKSFTAGLTVQEFDNIYNKEIAKKNTKNMRYRDYLKEKAVKIENEGLVLGGISSRI